LDWANSAYRIKKKNSYKVLIECEAKKLLERKEEDGRPFLKMALIKSNKKCGNYIQLVQRAVNGLCNTAINLHVP
jgi:hypothetical protein